jgi:glycosyltransferase involved in cell wall biosynthesis
VHQLIPNFTPADAMGQSAVAFRRALAHLGFSGEIYAGEVASAWHALVKPLPWFQPREDDVVLYHFGMASHLSAKVLHLNCKKGIVYHNVTPAAFYRGSRLEHSLLAARAQLSALAEAVDVAIGVSEFNCAELRALGYPHVSHVPLFVEPERFQKAQKTASIRLLCVGRVVPHKRVEDVLALFEEVQRIHRSATLTIVGGLAEGNNQVKQLLARAARLSQVCFTGPVGFAELRQCYAQASCLVSMSEHEGFGVPLIEGFAAGLPVIAFGCAAVPETMGERGIVFTEKNFAALAQVVSVLHENQALRRRIVAGQAARLRDFSFENTTTHLKHALQEVTPKRLAVVGHRRSSQKPNVALVVQRFGADILGGAEAHARQVALRLKGHVDLEIFTSCAVDHLTWSNAFPQGVTRDEGLTIHRFEVERPRDMRRFNRASREVFEKPNDFVTEALWLAQQGPECPSLLDALAHRQHEFKAIIFFTYLYSPTARGIALVKDKALVVPTAHEEPPLDFLLYRDVFESGCQLLCNTPEEMALIQKKFPRASRASVVGVGIEPLAGDGQRFVSKFNIQGPYLLSLGRLEAGKGVLQLVKNHAHLVKNFHDAPTLVLAGSGPERPTGERVVLCGRLSEEDKWDALAGAMAVVVPSQFESLSLAALEAFASGTPVLGNEYSEVVAGQLRRSGGGLTYRPDSMDSFVKVLQHLGARREYFSENAKRFARGLNWNVVIQKYLKAIQGVSI